MTFKRVYGQRHKYKKRIEEALLDAGLNQTTFAARIGLSRQAVNATLFGKNDSETVLQGLRELGVKERYLCDPTRLAERV